MKKRTLAEIKAHALETPQLEVCGFVLNVAGRETVRRARNISSCPDQFFSIAPEEFAVVEGDIVAIYHSHPASLAAPSSGDLAACNRSGFPWVIYSVPKDAFAEVEPEGLVAPLLGRQFLWGVHDCGTLLVDYYRELLGISLVYEPYPELFWRDPEHKPYLTKLQENGFELVHDLREHDVILMQLSADVPNHVAIYQAGGIIMHHVQNRLSCRDVYGGYWREITRHILRHRSQM